MLIIRTLCSSRSEQVDCLRKGAAGVIMNTYIDCTDEITDLINVGSTFRISTVEEGISGDYMCHASNEYGTIHHNFRISVFRKFNLLRIITIFTSLTQYPQCTDGWIHMYRIRIYAEVGINSRILIRFVKNVLA